MSFLLGQMVEIENHLSKTRQDFANLEKELKILNESISNISQWIELLDMAIEAGLKNSLFSQNMPSRGLTLQKRLLLLKREK